MKRSFQEQSIKLFSKNIHILKPHSDKIPRRDSGRRVISTQPGAFNPVEEYLIFCLIFFNLFQYFSDPKNGRSCRGDCTWQGGPGSRGQVSRFAETDVVLCCVVSDRLLRWLRQMPCCVVSAFVAHLSLSLGC